MQNFKAGGTASGPGNSLMAATLLAASLMTLTACDDAPAPPPSKFVVIDRQTLEIPAEAFATILSYFEGTESPSDCVAKAESLGGMINDLQIMPAGDFDPARFVIGLANERDGASDSYEIAFDAVGNMCSLSQSSTLTGS